MDTLLEEAKKEARIFTGGGLVRSIGGIDEHKEHLKGPKWAYDDRVLGSGKFVEDVLKKAGAIATQKLLSEESNVCSQRP